MSSSGQLIDAGVKVAYGLENHGGRWAVVQAVWRRNRLHTETLLRPDRDTPKSEVEAVQRNIEADVRLGHANSAAAVRVQDSVIRWLTAPFPSVSKARQVLPSLLDVQLPFPLEQAVYDFTRIEPSEQGSVRALAAAVRRDSAEARLNECRQAGWDPLLLDHEGLALWDQALREKPADPDVPRIVLYLGEEHTSFVVGTGQNPLSAHGSRAGLHDVAGDSGGSAHVDPQEAVRSLSGKIRRVLTSLTSSSSNSLQWIWTGPGAVNRDITESIESSASVSCGVDPVPIDDPSTFLARSLATRGVQAGALGCNFRKDDLVHEVMKRRMDARRMKMAWTYAAFGLFLVVLNIGALGLLARKDLAYQRLLEQRAHELAPEARIQKGLEVRAVEQAQSARRERYRPLLDHFKPSLTGLLRGALDVSNAAGLRLGPCTFGSGVVSIQGSAVDWDRCEILSAHLKQSGYEVAVDREDAGADERVHFVIKGVRIR